MSRKNRRKKKTKDEAETLEAAAAETPQGADDDGGENVDNADIGSDPARTQENGAESESADEELERLAAEAKEMRQLAQRKQAEFENYRKRIERERAETFKHAAFDVVKELLPVLDNLERAVEASKSDQDGGNENQLREGIEIVSKQFRDTLVRLGLSEVAAKNKPFDPHVHEAVSRVETDEYPEGTVVEVLQKGYLFKDRLLRPSMVSVSLPREGGSSESHEDHEDEDEPVPYRK